MDPIIKPKDLYPMLSLSRPTVDRMIARNEFPEAKELSPRRKGWPRSWVDEWLRLGREEWTRKHKAGETLPAREARQTADV